MSKPNALLVSTRKGLMVYQLKANQWQFHSNHFEGIPVSLAHVDHRNSTWWACLDHGHWGVKLHRSKDQGKNWQEVVAPTFPEGAEIKEGVPATTNYLWAFADGGETYPNRLWIGTEPGGLFVSENGGDSFELVDSLWNHPSRSQWLGGGMDNAGIHSIVVDPENNDHLYIGISCAGVFETHDAGKTWEVRNKGLRADFLPDPHAEIGHDPHLLVAANSNFEIMWQQNHCGIFNSSNGGKDWKNVSQEKGPANFGFCIAVDPLAAQRAWVVPAVSDEMRIAIDKALCVCRTDDGGKSWITQRNGLPQKDCFDIVYRHAMAASTDWLAFGTTTGNVFLSNNKGDYWSCLSNYLPMVHAVQFAKI